MAFDAHTNFAYAAVLTAPVPDTSGTTLVLAAGTGALFPVAPFNATVWPAGEAPFASNAEIVRVTSRVGDVLTIVRAQEGTTARAIVVGDQCSATITVKVITDIEAETALTFSNANGVTFGQAGSTVTASVQTNYQSSGAYLTTAGLSQDSSKYAGTNGAITGGSITVNTSGVSVALPSYLTTAQPVGAYLTTARASTDALGLNTAKSNVTWTANSSGLSLDARGYAGTGTSATNASLTLNSLGLAVSVAAPGGGAQTAISGLAASGGTITSGTASFSNASGVSFGISGQTITATVKTDYQSSGAYLTTAALSQDSSNYAGTNGAITGGSITVNTSGVSVNLPAYLTTAMQSASSSVFAKTGFTSTTTAGTAIVGTLNTVGLSLGVPVFLTTAQSAGAYLTTARASTDAIGLNTAQSNVTWTANSSGLSLDARGYAGTGTSATNASVTLNSAGLAISVGAGGGGFQSAGFSTQGNTSGDTGFASQSLRLVGGNNITLSGSTAAGGLTLTISGANIGGAQTGISGLAAAGGTITSGTASFSNASGVSFGVNGQTITASVKTDYLTTQSGQAFSADASSTFQTLTFQDSNGVSFSNNAGALRVTHALQFTSATSAITSAALHTSASRVLNIVAATNSTGGGTASLSSNVSFSAANGITFYTSAGGAIVGSHNARVSTDAIGLNTAQTNVTWTANSAGLSLNASGYAGTVTGITGGSLTVNSAGVSLNLPAYLTTADLSANSSKYAQEWALTGNTAGTTSSAQGTRWYFSGGNSLTISGSSNSLVFSVGAYLTTAMQSASSSVFAKTGFTSTTTAGTAIVGTHDTAGLSLGVPAFLTTAQSVGAYLTTAALSQDSSKYAGTAGAITGGSITVNTSGVSVNLPAYLTTAMASNRASDFVAATAAFAGTNASGTIASTGISVSVAAAGAASLSGYALGNTTGQSSSSVVGLSSVSISGAGNVSVGYSGSALIISGGSAAPSPVNFSAGTTSGNLGSVVFSNSGGLSFGLSGSTITASANTLAVTTVGTATTVYPIATANSVGTVTRWAAEDHRHGGKAPDVSYWDNLDYGAGAATANVSMRDTVNNQIMVFPLGQMPGDATALTFMLNVSSSATGASSSAPKVATTRMGLYTLTGGSLSLVNSFASAVSITANAANSTLWSGQRWVTVGTSDWSSSPVFSAGVRYYGALVISTGGNNSNPQTGGFIGIYPYSTAARSGVMNVAVTTASSLGFHPWLGVFSASSNLPTTMQPNQITKGSASANFIPHVVINNVTSYF